MAPRRSGWHWTVRDGTAPFVTAPHRSGWRRTARDGSGWRRTARDGAARLGTAPHGSGWHRTARDGTAPFIGQGHGLDRQPHPVKTATARLTAASHGSKRRAVVPVRLAGPDTGSALPPVHRRQPVCWRPSPSRSRSPSREPVAGAAAGHLPARIHPMETSSPTANGLSYQERIPKHDRSTAGSTLSLRRRGSTAQRPSLSLCCSASTHRHSKKFGTSITPPDASNSSCTALRRSASAR